MTRDKGFKGKAMFLMIVVVSLFLPVTESFAQTSRYPCWGMGPWMMGGSWGWIGGILMIFFWILMLVALVLFIRWLVGVGANRSRISPGERQITDGPLESAVDILKKRYARGEITKEQFESMRRDIE